MAKIGLWWVFLSSFFINTITATDDFQPQQLHIAIGETNVDMVITWVTFSDPQSSIVEYGTKDINTKVTGNTTKFTDGGSEKREMWMHRVVLKGLTPDTRYFYHCGSKLGWSSIYAFKTWKEGNDWPVRVALYGDLGAVNAQSLPRLQQEIAHGLHDVVIHVGDFAYDMNSDNARVGDLFMRQIESIAGYVPYMTCPGNHEDAYNFSNYKARFTMPNYKESENMYFSWNMGPIHFISVNTEAYYSLGYGKDPLRSMWNWLIQDLEEATKPEVRAERPWIILFGHKPMYCSNSDGHDCTKVGCLLRIGINQEFAMEEVLDKYGVDLAVWGHEHSYERLYPIYNYTIVGGSTEAPYTNPKGPVHLITGSAGCTERHAPFTQDQPEWSAYRSIDYGYTRLTVYNNTHLYWEQVSDDQEGAVIDSVWLVRDQHGPYSQLHTNDF